MRSRCNRTRDHFVVPANTRMAIFRPVRFCWYRILRSVVNKRSTAASSAAFNKSPLVSLSQPLALAVTMVWPPSARATPRGTPWSKRMSIHGDGGLRLWLLEALRHKFKHRRNLLPRHVELLHHFFDTQILKVLNDCGNRQPGIPEHPCAADLTRNAFHSGALRPIEIRHIRSPSFQSAPRETGKTPLSYDLLRPFDYRRRRLRSRRLLP